MSRLLGKFRRWMVQALTERIGLKLIAFVITLLLITLVRFQEETERFFDVEVVPIMPEPVSGLTMTSGFPRTLRLRLAGPSSVINAMTPGDIPPIEVDLRGRRAGTSHYYFSTESIEESLKSRSKKMQFVRVVRTSPESVQVKLEKVVSREVPVKINVDGQPAPGTELAESPEAVPSEVVLIGAASAMRGIKGVETDSVIIDGMGVGEHLRTVSAIPIEGVSIRGAESLRVTVKIRWIPGERVFKDLPVALQAEGIEADFKPSKVTVTLAGPKVKLDTLDASQIKPVIVVEPEKLQMPSVVTENVTLSWLPDNVRVVSIAPQSVRVSLTQPGASKTRKKDKKFELERK